MFENSTFSLVLDYLLSVQIQFYPGPSGLNPVEKLQFLVNYRGIRRTSLEMQNI